MRTIFTSLFLLTYVWGYGQALAEVDMLIKKELESDRVPALAVVVIDSGRVVHLSANGFSKLEEGEKATITTPFHIASVSKTVTNLAVFKLVEAGSIDLNTDINHYLPFEIISPYYPEDMITVRDLLNHRSGIKDDFKIYGPHWNEPKGDPKIGLEDFLEDYLAANGDLYKDNHFEKDTTYKSFAYSNTGVALLGLIVEHVSGTSYEAFCQKHIFKPLGMTQTSWFLKNLDRQQVAQTYVYEDSVGLAFKGHNGYPDYPAGQLRTSISDFSKLMVGYLNSDNSKFVLSNKTTSKITPSPQIAHNGYYTWFVRAVNNHLYYSHGGGDTGVRTVAIIDVNNKNGIAIFCNAQHDLSPLLRAIENHVFSERE